VAFGRARSWLEGLLVAPRFSSLYRSLPLLDTDQDEFWNAAAAGQWSGTAEGLLERLLRFAAALGRQRDPARPKGPRVLDLDLLVAGDAVVTSPRLTVPHAGLADRQFALDPLVEVGAGADPRDGVSWAQKAARVAGQGVDRTDRTW
jgi:2-amino-4-hydroxy-6-hydroxymethyldihydropteridine diphosphokinase